MIDLEAATVLLQWSTGGLLFLWITTRRREVGLGYGWLLRGCYSILAFGAFVAGLRYGVVPIREISSAGVVIASVAALGSSIVRRQAGVAGHVAEHDRRSARVAAMTGIERDPVAVDRLSSGPEFDHRLDLVAPVIGLIGLI